MRWWAMLSDRIEPEPLVVSIDLEGVVRVSGIPRGAPVVLRLEVLERMLTEAYGEGLSARSEGRP